MPVLEKRAKEGPEKFGAIVSNGAIGRRLLNVEEAAQYLGLSVDNRPSNRVISLERSPKRSRVLKQECSASLVCESCLRTELNEFYEALGQLGIPLEAEENEESYLTRPIGLVVIPMSLHPSDARRLVEELECGCDRPVPVEEPV